MKNLFLFICMALSVNGYAQRPTEGCGYSVSVVGIVPGVSVYTLYNGTNYTVKLEFFATGNEIYGGL